MAQNKVQYQRGLSMPEFFERYASAQQCEDGVRAWRWPKGFVCPRCQGSWHSEFRRQERLYFQCSGCRYQCSLVSGTIFESSKLPLPSGFLAMHLMTQAKNNVSALELKRHLGVSYPTAWLLKHKRKKLRRAVRQEVWRQAEAGRRVRLMFQDEGRFGLLGTPRRCWAPQHVRPVVSARLERKYLYASVPSARTTASWTAWCCRG